MQVSFFVSNGSVQVKSLTEGLWTDLGKVRERHGGRGSHVERGKRDMGERKRDMEGERHGGGARETWTRRERHGGERETWRGERETWGKRDMQRETWEEMKKDMGRER